MATDYSTYKFSKVGLTDAQYQDVLKAQEMIKTPASSPTPTPGTPPAPDPRGSSYTPPAAGTYQSEASKYFASQPMAMPDEATIRQKTRDEVQGLLDSIQNTYAGLLATEAGQAKDRTGQTRAITARSGTLGSDFGTAALDKTAQFNEQQAKSLMAERDMKIGAVLANANTRADEKLKAEREFAAGNQSKYLDFLKSTADATKGDLLNLAKSGASVQDFTDQEYKSLLDQSGYTPKQLDALFTINKPKADVLTSMVQGSKYIVVSRDPITKATKTETIDLGFSVPAGMKTETIGDNTLVFYPEKFDPKKPIKDQIMTYTVDQATDGLKNAPNSYKEWSYAGKPGTYADWVKKSDGTFKPTADEKSAVERYIAKYSDKRDTDSKKATEDPGFFYFMLQKAVESKEFNIQPFKYPFGS